MSREQRSVFDMPAAEFRSLGYELVDRIAEFYESLNNRQLVPAADAAVLGRLLGGGELPEAGKNATELFEELAPQLFDQSLHNGHPRFMGYITSSAAPVGALADMLAAAVNTNLGKWDLSQLASAIEKQAVGWIADIIGYDRKASGLMVSGGNMANFAAFVAARTAMAPWPLRTEGNYGDPRRLTAYVSTETHTWIQKAADVCGLGSRGIRWIDTDPNGRIRVDLLREQIETDRRDGCLPFLVVGTGGSVGTGVVDPLRELADLCRRERLWLHVDGAYGAPAAILPEAPADLRALALADSVAVDPHKWLYCPIEVACVLTKRRDALKAAFGFRPSYYPFAASEAGSVDFFELGMQNTRGFRALKVWLGLRNAGRSGVRDSIRGDIRLAERLYALLDGHPQFQAGSCNLSIATFRYVPKDLDGDDSAETESYLNSLNEALLGQLQASGEVFLSNALIGGRYLLRACIVNFRTADDDIDQLPAMIAAFGAGLDRQMRPAGLQP